MNHKYVIMYVSENSDVLDIKTDDFEEDKSHHKGFLEGLRSEVE